jgi:hypothetical protein
MLQWLDSKITQWQLWYFRAFKMRSMPRPPDELINMLRAEQEAKEQEKRGAEKKEALEKQNAARLASSPEESKQEESIPDERDRIPKSWLQEKISLQQAEADRQPSSATRCS